jgi:hypothetical protein
VAKRELFQPQLNIMMHTWGRLEDEVRRSKAMLLSDLLKECSQWNPQTEDCESGVGECQGESDEDMD